MRISRWIIEIARSIISEVDFQDKRGIILMKGMSMFRHGIMRSYLKNYRETDAGIRIRLISMSDGKQYLYGYGRNVFMIIGRENGSKC